MNHLLDYIGLIFLVFAMFMLYMIIPFMTAYYLYKKLWLSDRMRLFLSISLFISSIGIAFIVFIKMIA